MYTDLYLKFASKEEADAILFDGDRAKYINTDVIGVIHEQVGVDPEGLPQFAPLDGWHVNVRLMPDEDTAPLQAFSVVVNTPYRVWAG